MPFNFYHRSPIENRESIMKNGLVAQTGECYAEYWERHNFLDKYDYKPAVFLYAIPGRMFAKHNTDLWKINLSYIDVSLLAEDPAAIGFPNHKWYMYYGNIPPEALERKHTHY